MVILALDGGLSYTETDAASIIAHFLCGERAASVVSVADGMLADPAFE